MIKGENDYKVDTPEYKHIRKVVDAWSNLIDTLQERILKVDAEQNLFDERLPKTGLIKQMERFMLKYGYRDGARWWVPVCKGEEHE